MKKRFRKLLSLKPKSDKNFKLQLLIICTISIKNQILLTYLKWNEWQPEGKIKNQLQELRGLTRDKQLHWPLWGKPSTDIILKTTSYKDNLVWFHWRGHCLSNPVSFLLSFHSSSAIFSSLAKSLYSTIAQSLKYFPETSLSSSAAAQ